jgi:hypothetical protein
MDNEEAFRNIAVMAKRAAKQGGDCSPTFFLERADGSGLDIISAQWTPDTKDKLIDALRAKIVADGVTRYFFASSSWIVTPESVASAIREAVEDVQKTGDAVEFGKRIMSLSLNPANNPAREECLQVVRFDKKSGTDMMMFRMIRDGEELSFGPEERHSGTLMARMNVWTPVQISADDGEDADDD